MKKTMFLVACLVAMATTVSAQFMNSGSTKSGNSFGGDSYTGIRLHYNSFEIEDADAVPSFGVTFIKGWSISQEMPLFLEAGAGISYTSGDIADPESEWWDTYDTDDTGYGSESTMSSISIEVPVNIGYKFELTDEFSIMPFIGVTARFNIIGKAEFKEWEKIPSVTEFLKEDMGIDSKDPYYDDAYEIAVEAYEENDYNADGYTEETIEDDLKKIQLGWQIGARAMYKQFNFGVNYGADFNEIAEDAKAKSLVISVGYNF